VGTDILGASDTILGGCDTYSSSFANTESKSDQFVLNKQVVNQENASATDTSNSSMLMVGTASGSSFSYSLSSSVVSQLLEGGNTTYNGVVTPFNESQGTTVILELVVTGPPATTVTVESVSVTSSSGSNNGANLTELTNAGDGYSAGSPVAAQLGSSPVNSGLHMGTSPGGLDSAAGLLSALGGEAVHGLLYGGADVLPAVDAAGTGIWLEESYQSGSTPTNWVSHPAGIGYRRTLPATASSSGHAATPAIPGNFPYMDSGTSDGSSGAELGRLTNFLTGGNENPNATQPGPTPRHHR